MEWLNQKNFRYKKLKNLNKEIYSIMNFDIEHKLNRDTFNNFYNKEIIIYNHDYYLYLFPTSKNIY